ncbi:Uncharacterized protein HZ326_21657 [Fusarium oxysporum f. sp. albedinis]|nr:Uncharacterized protein HZ326_21657 [Fusarium oxysporum f. sp. albedinis]
MVVASCLEVNLDICRMQRYIGLASSSQPGFPVVAIRSFSQAQYQVKGPSKEPVKLPCVANVDNTDITVVDPLCQHDSFRRCKRLQWLE